MARPPRLTIAALMLLVFFCAATFAAIRTSSPYAASAMVSLTVLALLGSVVAALWGRRRAGWSGFAIFGWGYFLLAFASPFHDVVRPHLLTSVAIVESYRYLRPDVPAQIIDVARLPQAGMPIGPTLYSIGAPEHMPTPRFIAVAGGGPRPVIPVAGFSGINSVSNIPTGRHQFYTYECSSHAGFTLAFAGLGGLFAAWVARRAATPTGSGRPEGEPA